MVEHVVGSCTKFERVVFLERKTLEERQIPVVDGTGRQCVSGSGGECTLGCLNIVSIRVDGNVANDVCRAGGICGSRSAEVIEVRSTLRFYRGCGASYAVRVDDGAI